MIVAGFGFRAGAPLESLRAALRLAQRGHPSVTHLATVTDKLSGLSPLGQALDLPVLAISPEALSSVATPTRSVASLAAYASGSVAEASALCAAGLLSLAPTAWAQTAASSPAPMPAAAPRIV